MTTEPLERTVSVRTTAAPAGALLDHLPEDGPLAWVRGGDGLVGWGVAARLEVSGPHRFRTAARWWRDLTARMAVEDPLQLPGTGPVVFSSFAFDETSPSVLVVPRVVVGRRDGVSWVSTVDDALLAQAPRPPRRPAGVRWSEGNAPVMTWRASVASAVERIRGGELDKVVLAYDLLATAQDDVDVRWLLHRLAERYPSCWVFSVEGLAGATPELLVRRTGDRVGARVLAGTVRRTGDAADDARAAAGLLGSAKDLEEHAYAVRSLVDVLRTHCAEVSAPDAPVILDLPNVLHLATDVEASGCREATALELAGALHPTAAVGGTPTRTAVELVRELEAADRGRYAGPVGWMDARGDGELGIALRCAQLDGRSVRLFAGCGIVAGSDPDDEVAEASAKFLPVRDALEG